MGNTDNSWNRIQQGLKETERLMSQNQYNMAMIKARQTLEFMVNSLGEKALVVDGDLADSIDQLFEGHWIPQTTKDHYHRIRVIGNKAVHDGDDSPYDANEAYQLLTEEVRAFADIYNGRQQTSSPSGYQQRPAQNRPAGTRPASSRSAASSQRSPQRPQTRTAQSRSSQGSVSRTGGTARTSASRPAAAGSSRGTASSRSGQRQAHSGSRSRRRPANQSFDPYMLLKPALILIIVIILVVIITRLIPNSSDETETTTAPVSTEEMTENILEPIPTEAPTTEAPDPVYITTARLNVRAEPSTSGERLGTLAAGTQVEYVDHYDDTWVIIMFDGQEAYVSGDYLEEAEPATEEAPSDSDQTSSEESSESL